MDRLAVKTANILLGNGESEASLEMHFPAPVLKFNEHVSFVLTGAEFEPRLNSRRLDGNTIQTAKPGDVLDFKKRHTGQRCYLSVKNGFKLDEWLGSKSTNLAASISGFKGRRLSDSDILPFSSPELTNSTYRVASLVKTPPDERLRFVPGPAFRDLTALSMFEILYSRFFISNDSNRMGYRLEGPSLTLLDDDDRISSGVTFGTIQLLPDKKLIILMADHQTTGGYANLGTVIGPDLSVLAQLGSGDRIRFQSIPVSKAEDVVRNRNRDLAFLRTGLRLRKTWNS